MPAVHVRDLDDAIVAALKKRAATNRRSLQGELKLILEEAAFGRSRAQGKRKSLRLHTVRVGQASTYSRDDIYDDDGR
jgi:plasmid stability protein